MNQLTRRVEKLEAQAVCQDEELILDVCFVSPKGYEVPKDQRHKYPPMEEQITAARAAGKKIFLTYRYEDDPPPTDSDTR